MSIDEQITKTVEKVVKLVLTAEFAKLKKEIMANKPKNEQTKEELLQIGETLKILHTTRDNLQILIDMGKVKTCTPPNGKTQILASSLYDYMRGAC